MILEINVHPGALIDAVVALDREGSGAIEDARDLLGQIPPRHVRYRAVQILRIDPLDQLAQSQLGVGNAEPVGTEEQLPISADGQIEEVERLHRNVLVLEGVDVVLHLAEFILLTRHAGEQIDEQVPYLGSLHFLQFYWYVAFTFARILIHNGRGRTRRTTIIATIRLRIGGGSKTSSRGDGGMK